jgi:hypothetical protein
MLRTFRARSAMLAAIALAAVALASQPGFGCGGDSYKSQAKGIIEGWTKTEQRLETTLEAEMVKLGGTIGVDIAALEVMQPIIVDIIAAAGTARSDLQGLTPSAATQTFHDDYLSGLQVFIDRARELSGLFDYLGSAFAVLAEVVPQEGGDGVWGEVGKWSETVVSTSNAADIASTLNKAAGVMQDASALWIGISPPEGLAGAHDTLGTEQQGLGDTLTGMAETLVEYADSGSRSDLGSLKTLWEKADVQLQTFSGGMETWYGEVNALGAQLTGTLDDAAKGLGVLKATLDEL